MKNTTLTPDQANLVKDILKTIGGDDELTEQFALATNLDVDVFNDLCDTIFEACGNGRVTFVS